MTTDDASSESTDPRAALDASQIVFSHGGLSTVDPWAEQRRPLQQVLWPWGWRGLAETLEVIALAMIMFVGVRAVAHNYRVDGSSMVPTFHDGDALIVNRLAYRTFDLGWIPVFGRDGWQPFGAPTPGDVVIFIAQTVPAERDFVKRIVAVPGQTVAVSGGHVIVDGVAYAEPYIAEPPNYEYQPQVVPPGKLFVLGDNRNNSQDSHIIGMVDQHELVGRVDLRYWPPRAATVIHGEFGTPIGAPGAMRIAPGMPVQSEVSSFP